MSSATRPNREPIDALSKKIIEQLQEDGRRAYATIGKAVGLSEAAVRQRVQKLIENNVMQIVAVTDPLQTGFDREALIGVNVNGDIDGVADALSEMAVVDYVVITAGSFDIICEILATDNDHLLEILAAIRAIPGVRTTETFMYLRLKKQIYNWGTN